MRDPQRNRYMTAVYGQMLGDLTYPVTKDGTIMDLSGVKALVCWHLVRCGWRKPNNTDGLAAVEEYDEPIIKRRKVYGPGVAEDAIRWIGADESDDPLADLDNMTIGQIEALPDDDVKIEAKRRLGMLPPTPEPDPEAGWHVQPFVTIIDEPDNETEWTS